MEVIIVYLTLKCRQKTHLQEVFSSSLAPQFPTEINTDTSLKKLVVALGSHHKPVYTRTRDAPVKSLLQVQPVTYKSEEWKISHNDTNPKDHKVHKQQKASRQTQQFQSSR